MVSYMLILFSQLNISLWVRRAVNTLPSLVHTMRTLSEILDQGVYKSLELALAFTIFINKDT